MDLKNMNYAFYREYLMAAYSGRQDAKTLNRELLDIVNSDQSPRSAKDEILRYGQEQCGILSHLKDHANGSGNTVLFQECFKTTYPGTLIGSGYPHITGKMKGEIQNGFCLDHIFGSPYYPGSSLKGVLEDPFQRALYGRNAERTGYMDYVLQLVRSVTGREPVTAETVRLIWKQSFQGEKPGGENESMRDRDVFFDAYVTKADRSAYNRRGDILGLDNITPHEKLQEPVPVTVLRLMPDVGLTFTMLLHDVKNPEEGILISAAEKAEIFTAIIEDMGIGSKTNLGYGVLKRERTK